MITIQGAGADTWEREDEFHIVYKPLKGDGSVTTKLLSAEEGNEWSKFGIQVRETTLAESRYTGLLVTPLHGIRAPHRRAYTNGWSDDVGPNEDEITYPVHLRIQRRGDEIKLFTSQDGTTFAEYGSPATTIMPNLPANVQVGLLGTSHEDGTVARTRFDQITLTTP